MDKKKILIVDDDSNIAELISLYLTKECFQCEIAPWHGRLRRLPGNSETVHDTNYYAVRKGRSF